VRIPVELPLLALAMAMQGETIARFGGVSLQTIVVTNNMVKFSDALVGRYLSAPGRTEALKQVPELKDVLMPGLAWLTYSLGAATGATIIGLVRFPLLLPAIILVFVVIDLLTTGGNARAAPFTPASAPSHPVPPKPAAGASAAPAP
jgi:uncharacterized membrane protein YoaK (UPF0700 family)